MKMVLRVYRLLFVVFVSMVVLGGLMPVGVGDIVFVEQTHYRWSGIDGCVVVVSNIPANGSVVGDAFSMDIHIGDLPPGSSVLIYKEGELDYTGDSLKNLGDELVDVLYYPYKTHTWSSLDGFMDLHLVYLSTNSSETVLELRYEILSGAIMTSDEDLYQHGRLRDDELVDMYTLVGVYEEPSLGWTTVQKYLLMTIVVCFAAGFLGYMFGRKMVNKAYMVWGTVAEYDFSWTLGFGLLMSAGAVAWYITRDTLAKLGQYQRTGQGLLVPSVTTGELTEAVFNIAIVGVAFLFFWGWYKFGVRFTEGAKPSNFHVTNAQPDESEEADIVVNIEPLVVKEGFAIPVRRKPYIGVDGRMRLVPVTSFDYWRRLIFGYQRTCPVFVMLERHRLVNAPWVKIQGSRGYYLDALEVETLGSMYRDTEDQIVGSAVRETEREGQPVDASVMSLRRPSKTLEPRRWLSPYTWKWVQRRRESARRNRFALVAVPSYGMAGTEATLHNIAVNRRAARNVEATEELLGLYGVKDQFDILHAVSTFLNNFFQAMFHRMSPVTRAEEEEAEDVRDYYRDRSLEVDNQTLEEGTLGG